MLPAAFLRARIRPIAVVVAASVLLSALPAARASAATAPGTIAVDFAWSGINGSGSVATQAFTSRVVRAQFAFGRWVWSADARTAPVVGRLQRKVGAGAWRSTTQSVTTRTSIFDVRIRPYSLSRSAKSTTVQYRVKVPTGGMIREGDVSPAVTVRYRNAHRYTGFTRALARAVHAYCPAATIRVMRLPGDEAGQQPLGLYELRISPSVRAYSAAYRRSVVLHECGHFLQWRNYGGSSTGYRLMLRQAKRIYGTNHTDPMEHMADCISRAAEPRGYLGYGGTCTDRQLRYARKVLSGDRLY